MNILDEIRQEVLSIKELLKKQTIDRPAIPRKMTFKEYAEHEDIQRQTIYSRIEKGLIKVEKIGGKNYVLIDENSFYPKYQRQAVD